LKKKILLWSSDEEGQERQTLWYKQRIFILLELCKYLKFEEVDKIYWAMDSYFASSYGRMNKILRGGGTTPNARYIDLYVKYAPKVTSNIVYRGIPKEMLDLFKEGGIFQDFAFLSCTFDKNVALWFSNRKHKSNIIAVIKGVRGIGVEGFYYGGNEGEYWKEQEVLLPRNLKFRVGSIIQSKNITEINLQII